MNSFQVANLYYFPIVGWARTYLKKAGLLDAPRKGVINITERGKATLDEDLTEINVKYLSKFPEFIQFKLQSRDEKIDGSIISNIDASIISNEEAKKQTPEELIESGYESIRSSLEEEIL